MRIIFMGTPDFAVASLRALVENGYNVVGVVTMPDKPAGRGHHLQASPVKQYALRAGLPVLQPERLRDPAFLQQLQSLRADLQIVVAFRMLPEVVWSMPPMGTFNLHASLLPRYRGAAPINWAIINGETETGVTTFMLRHDIDTGDIIMQQSTPIAPDEDCGTLHDRLMEMGAHLVTCTVDRLEAGHATFTPQSAFEDEALRPAPKLFRDTCHIDFTRTAAEIHNFVRGLSPHPAAWSMLQLPGMTEPVQVKIFAVKPVTTVDHAVPGSISTDGRSFLRVSCSDGYVELLNLQLPGKRRMSIRDLLNGLVRTA